MNTLDVANLALRRIGDKAISSFIQAESTASRACSLFFRPAFNEITMQPDHRWSFAIRRVDLQVAPGAENKTGFKNAFAFPPGALRVVALSPAGAAVFEGPYIFSNKNELQAKIIQSLVTADPDPIEFVTGARLPELFLQAGALRLAMHLALSLGKQKDYVAIQREYFYALMQAKGQDAGDTEVPQRGLERWDEVR